MYNYFHDSHLQNESPFDPVQDLPAAENLGVPSHMTRSLSEPSTTTTMSGYNVLFVLVIIAALMITSWVFTPKGPNQT